MNLLEISDQGERNNQEQGKTEKREASGIDLLFQGSSTIVFFSVEY